MHTFYVRDVKQQDRIKYGAGVVAGVLALRALRKLLRQIPVVGPYVLDPVLGVLPPMLAGAALGVSAVYTLEAGNVAQAQALLAPNVRKRMRGVQKEVAAAVDDAARDVRRLQQQHARAMEQVQREGEAAAARVLPALDRQLAEAEQQVLPVLQSKYEQGQRELDRLAAAGPARDDRAAEAVQQQKAAGSGGGRRSSTGRRGWWGHEDDELSG